MSLGVPENPIDTDDGRHPAPVEGKVVEIPSFLTTCLIHPRGGDRRRWISNEPSNRITVFFVWDVFFFNQKCWGKRKFR